MRSRASGLDGDIGSLEVGKLADLQVLTANPLDDLRNTTSIRYVMKNGRLYDADTLTEIWPRQRPLPEGGGGWSRMRRCRAPGAVDAETMPGWASLADLR